MNNDFQKIFTALSGGKVNYLVIGGVAIVLSGYVRNTMDLDILPELSEENLKKLIRVLKKLGYYPRLPVRAEDLADRHKRMEWIENKNLKVFSFIHKNQTKPAVDVMLDSPIDYFIAEKRKQTVRMPATRSNRGKNIEVYIASVEDLIALKKSAGRLIDRNDLMVLQNLNKKLKNEKK